MKKILAFLLCIITVFTCVPLTAFAISPSKLDVITARNIASLYVAIWPFTDDDGDTFSFGKDFTLSHSEEISDETGDTIALAFEISSSTSNRQGYVVLSLDSEVPVLAQIGLGEIPAPESVVLVDSDELNEEQKSLALQENALLIDAVEEIEQKDELSLTEKLERLIEKIENYFKYYLFSFWYGDDWDAESANRDVEAHIREYAAENGSVLTGKYTVDKNYCVPNTQSYFFGSEEYYDGICGVAAWEMLLGYYRDGLGYDKLPDDKTMYIELMAIMDDITEKVLFGLDFLSDLNDIVTEYTDYYIPHDIRAHEIIGTLDAGIAIYLNSKGYTEEAKNILKNLSINVPLLTSAKRALMLSDLKARLADWIYEETDGKLRCQAIISRSAEDTVVRSLKRGEPVVIGNWFALDETRFTNHYFTAVGLYEIEGEIELADGISFKFSRKLVEVYDTWRNNGSAFIDLDNLTLKAAYNANSIADL